MQQIATGVEIPEEVIIPCPAMDFKNRYACKACPDCENFKGIGIMCLEPDYPWHKKYTIRCAHVMERRTLKEEAPEVIEE